ncbi:dehydrogenase [Sorangium cellulosum]|uniref:Dehydrogenase n=1 Tax=Sorangium cellulosum TaxID=56 RepID=A0A150S3M0_SORCE|nr:dehydrogenase [Sorangium cellulosum]KYG01910.1 dehydrogenase [Sorangium cellulosum]
MRFIITAAPGTNDTKLAADGPPDEELFAAYMKYNEEMMKAGVLIASEGLNPGGARARVGISGGKRTVLDGPFVETKELVGGFYLIEVSSKEEAIAWALRCPVGFGSDEVLTIQQMTELSDIPPRFREIIADVAPTWSASFSRAR